MTLFMTILGLVLFIALIAYPILIMPHMLHRPDYSLFGNFLFAHRGLHNNKGKAPENSLQAFRLACEAGYGIELDIRLSKDKVPMVFHDETLHRLCGIEGKFEEFTCEELQKFTLCDSKETIPTLKQVLEEIKGRVPIIIEYKVNHGELSLCGVSMKLLDEYKGDFCIESFNPLVLRWFKKNRKEIIRGQLSTNFNKNKDKGNKILYFLHSRLVFNRLGKPDFIAYQFTYPHSTSLTIIKGLYGLPTVAWTIRNQEELDESKKHFNYIIFDSFIPK